MVERCLAKANVASSNLVSRSTAKRDRSCAYLFLCDGKRVVANSPVRVSIAYSNRHTPRFPQNCRNNFAKGYGVISFPALSTVSFNSQIRVTEQSLIAIDIRRGSRKNITPLGVSLAPLAQISIYLLSPHPPPTRRRFPFSTKLSKAERAKVGTGGESRRTARRLSFYTKIFRSLMSEK